MTFPTINAAFQIGGLPNWAAVLIFIAIFIAAAVISGFVSYKLRTKRLREKNDVDELPRR
ncbi:MAG: hypothetical protein J6K77_06625 [Ruminococcus sp.]|nr:hypothetical protein [Ruminococcus sp.]